MNTSLAIRVRQYKASKFSRYSHMKSSAYIGSKPDSFPAETTIGGKFCIETLLNQMKLRVYTDTFHPFLKLLLVY